MRISQTLAALAIGALLPSLAVAQSSDTTYTNAVHRWSITYPRNWTIDTRDPAFVRLSPPASLARGVIGVHVGPVQFATADALVDMVVRSQSAAMPFKVLSRKTIYLADSLQAVELDSELGQGTVGRSRRVFVLQSGNAYIIDGETFLTSWPALEPFYARIINSFRLRRNER